MRATTLACGLSLLILLSGCSNVDISTDPVDAFAAGNYRYYKWRTDPLPKNSHSSDPIYLLDPAMRREVNTNLQAKGYIMDAERAQFSVDYLYAPGLREGAEPDQASNISHIPSVTPNRQVDQASVDNAIALGGVKETNNIVLQFNDVSRHEVVWRAALTKIVEDANRIDAGALNDNINKYVGRIMRDLPPAGSTAE